MNIPITIIIMLVLSAMIDVTGQNLQVIAIPIDLIASETEL